jgi:hypothetical protein
MNVQTVLLKVRDGSREGWQLMDLETFLLLVELGDWSDKELVVGTVLPAVRREVAVRGRSH